MSENRVSQIKREAHLREMSQSQPSPQRRQPLPPITSEEGSPEPTIELRGLREWVRAEVRRELARLGNGG